jgi:hypothetical protein
MASTDPAPVPGPAATVGGVATGLLFFILLMLPTLLAAALGGTHCAPAPTCRDGTDGWFLQGTALAAGPAVMLGAAARALFHWAGRWLLVPVPGVPAAARRTPWWATAVAPLSIWLGIALIWP